MGTFHDVEINMSNVSLDEGLSMYKRGAIRSIAYGYARRGKIVAGTHWSATWVNTQGMGNHGVAYATPMSKQAKQAVRKHTVDSWVNMGLTMRQAQTLYSAPVRYKHELVERIIECANDDNILEAFKCFPGVGVWSHRPWYDRWQTVVSESLEGLSWWRRDALINAVLLITGNSNK